MPPRNEHSLWYKDAIIYELHVKAFHDGSGDGIGDFRGLIEKLDYLQDLGVTALWVLPFYPSPLRDDGYDIADYRGVLPAYGKLRDFKEFVREAHRRDLKVITELVINHTSDQHRWFQEAREAKRGSAKRNYYVWSDSDEALAGTRIIFTDTETSNWAWDHEAGQYYWHRFFSHQPDLNLNNPQVVKAVMRVMKFWFDMGVDGMRLDAVPYLCVREGTNNENLPETHEVIRQFRSFVDEHYDDRMLLAEANMWPDDVRQYFGDGDECHMAYHFPVMPRIFMAIRQEDRHPITEILSRTPDIPDDCQWALFLRNHDELTLEMVTDEERDYMYREYATDPRMRCNVGIRRRLAPLVEGSRRRIELLNSLLFSFPGTPIIYYGDEIGMGDNIYLGDRDGVRTPMQWNVDRNAGFSRADPARLYLPVLMDPVYGYQAVNVEAQQRNPSSLLHFMRRMIALRRQHKAFGRGTIEFLDPDNRKVLVYLRKYKGEVILCVANLSRFVQAAELDLAAYDGWVPVEMIGRTEFPPIGELPYFVTLGPHSFYWFKLERQAAPLRLHSRPEDVEVSLPVVTVRGGWDGLLRDDARKMIEEEILPRYMRQARWFRGKARTIERIRVNDGSKLGGGGLFLAFAEVRYEDGGAETYSLPLKLAMGAVAQRIEREIPESLIARVQDRKETGVLFDALADQTSCCFLFDAMVDGRRYPTGEGGQIQALATPALERAAGRHPVCERVKRLSVEQSNTSVILDDAFVLKFYRRLEEGPSPDAEIGLFLTEQTDYRHIASVAGAIELRRKRGAPATVAMLQTFVPNQGDGWEYTRGWLRRYFEEATFGETAPPEDAPDLGLVALAGEPVPTGVDEVMGSYLAAVETLADRTAGFHRALASAGRRAPEIRPKEVSPAWLGRQAERFRAQAEEALTLLADARGRLDEVSTELAEATLDARDDLVQRFEAFAGLGRRAGRRVRVHGDYHLGQVLRVEGDFVLLDFEGEPLRPLAERRERTLALKDVAGMIRSFDYAAWSVVLDEAAERPGREDELGPLAATWERWVSAAFLRAWLAAAGDAPFVPARGGAAAGAATGDPLQTVLEAYLLDKALYELIYELNNRPGWVRIPLQGIARLLGGRDDDR